MTTINDSDSDLHQELLSPARIELRGKFPSRTELRVQKKGCPCAHCATQGVIAAWLCL